MRIPNAVQEREREREGAQKRKAERKRREGRGRGEPARGEREREREMQCGAVQHRRLPPEQARPGERAGEPGPAPRAERRGKAGRKRRRREGRGTQTPNKKPEPQVGHVNRARSTKSFENKSVAIATWNLRRLGQGNAL